MRRTSRRVPQISSSNAKVALLRRSTSIALCALAIAGCGGSFICSTIACASGVGFFLSPVMKLWPKAGRVRVCVDRECRSVSPSRGRFVQVGRFLAVAGPELRSPAVVRVSVDVLTSGNDALYRAIRPATVTKIAPNGVKCGPVCYVASAAIDPRTASLTTNVHEIHSLLVKHLIIP